MRCWHKVLRFRTLVDIPKVLLRNGAVRQPERLDRASEAATVSSFADIFISRSPGLMPEDFCFNMMRESKETLVGWGPSFEGP